MIIKNIYKITYWLQYKTIEYYQVGKLKSYHVIPLNHMLRSSVIIESDILIIFFSFGVYEVLN